MAVTERLALIIDADSKGAVRELEKVGKTAERELGKAETSLDRWGKQMTSVGVTMMAGAAVVGVALLDAASATSDLNEAADYSARVFGEASGEVAAFAESAEAIGLSERAAYEAATTFGDLLKATKASRTEVAGMSVEMAQLASDMASAKNTSPEDAVEALGAALRGESEPIRRYGVMLDEATLKQRALDMGLVETTKGTLPQSIKMQAAYAEIMAQTVGMQGNFADTADGAANRQRVMTATIENAKAELGEGFLPVMAQVIGVVGGAAGAFGGLNDATGGSVGNMLAVGTVVAGVGGTLAFTAGKAIEMRTALTGAAAAGNAAAASTLAAFGPVAVLFAGLAGSYMVWQAAMERGNREVENLMAGVDASVNDAGPDELRRKFSAINTEIEGLGSAIENSRAPWDADYRADLSKAGAALQAQNEEIAQTISIMESLAAETGESEASALAWIRAQEASGTAITSSEQALAMYEAQMQATGQSAEAATIRQAELNKQYDDAVSDLDKLISKISEYYGALDGTLDPQVQWETAIDSFSSTVSENGLAWDYMRDRLDITTEAGRQNLDVLRQQRDAAVAQGEAVLRSGGSTAEATAKTMEHVGALRAQWAAAGYSEAQINSLIDMLGLTPEQVTTAINQPGMAEAQNQTLVYQAMLAGIPRQIMTELVTTAVGAGSFVGSAAGRASGGPVTAGTPYIVGDGSGPELFVPSQSGTVVSPAQTAELASGAAAPTGGDVYLDGDKVGKWMAKALLGDKRARNGWAGVGS